VTRKPILIGVLLVLCLPRSSFPKDTYIQFVADEVIYPSAHYPEGPQLLGDGILVAEMPQDCITFVEKGSARIVWEASGCGPTSVKRCGDNGFWVLCHRGHYVVFLDSQFRTVLTINQTTSGRKILWPNDASTDSQGNLYLSSSGVFSFDAEASGRLIYINKTTMAPEDLAGNIHYSNGVLVQEYMRRILVSEHLNRRILEFPLLGGGRIGPPKVFFSFKDAPRVKNDYDLSGPDGIAAFTDGQVCVADYGNGRILLLSESGRFLTETQVRYPFVTNMAISSDQRSLYVTMTESNTSRDMHGIVQRFLVVPPKK
jgi:sugar lactone lactonase YvrE